MHSGFANLMAGADLVRIIATTAIIAGTLALVTEAPAQSPPSTYPSLLRDGFEVKSVFLLSTMRQRVWGSPSRWGQWLPSRKAQ